MDPRLLNLFCMCVMIVTSVRGQKCASGQKGVYEKVVDLKVDTTLTFETPAACKKPGINDDGNCCFLVGPEVNKEGNTVKKTGETDIFHCKMDKSDKANCAKKESNWKTARSAGGTSTWKRKPASFKQMNFRKH